MIALTSLSPNPDRSERQRFCVASWQVAGVDRVVSLNHPSEIEELRQYGLSLAETTDTSEDIYGKPFVQVSALLRWVANCGEPVLLVNADLELQMTREQLTRFAAVAHDGLGYLLQWNHGTDRNAAVREPCGLSGFFVRPEHANLCAPSRLLCFGQPWWDYWLPWMALHEARQRLYTTAKPTGWHEAHPGRWRQEAWDKNAIEFARLSGLDAGKDQQGHSRLAAYVNGQIRQHTTFVDLS